MNVRTVEQPRKRRVGRPRKGEERIAPEQRTLKGDEKFWKEKFDEYMKVYNGIKYEWARESEKGRIRFSNSHVYRSGVSLGLGSWMPENLGGIAFDILNNIPTVAYNFEYKVSEPLSLIAYMFQPNMVCQGVDIVLQQITLRIGMPVEEMTDDEVIVYNKKTLAKEVFERKYNILHVVYPKANACMGEQSIFYKEMDWYMSVIRRFLYRKARKTVYAAFGAIMNPEKVLNQLNQ